VDKPLKSVTHGQCDARSTVAFPAAGHHRLLTGTKLYCSLTDARVCEQLAQRRYLKVERPGVEPATFFVASQRPNHYINHDLKYKCILQTKYMEAILSNCARKLLWFEITKTLIAVLNNKLIVSFFIIFGILSFPMLSSHSQV